MEQLAKYKIVFWDFDGVILDSNKIRTEGFRSVLKNYATDAVEKLIEFHESNGGLSRYVKFNFFFEKVLNQEPDKEVVANLCSEFSKIMRKLLSNKEYLIDDTNAYIKQFYNDQVFYITSGSDQEELRYLCQQLGIQDYFKGIFGSPTPKIVNVATIIKSNNLLKSDCCLIGDSINDKEAADANDIGFVGYNFI